MPLIRRRTAASTASDDTGGRGLLVRRPRVDPAYGDPRLTRLRALAADGDWPAVRDLLALLAETAGTGEQADSGEELSWLVEGLMTVRGSEVRWGQAVAEAPGDPLALLVCGARHIEWAWEARTRKMAKYVSREQFEVFHARLRIAEEQLYEVAERRPHWVAPWYLLQITGRGLQVGQETAARRFEAAARRCPGHLSAHRQHVQQVCPKWGGSWERTHDFARTSMLSAPEGSALGELVAIGHLEQWLAEQPRAADGGWLRRPDVVAGLHEAADRSVRHRDFVRRRDWTRTFNTFALAFALAGERRAAAELFGALGGRATEFPWMYLDGQNPTAPFRAWRSRVGG